VIHGLGDRSLSDYRNTLWSIIEFFACDPPIRELGDEAPRKYLAWLRETPVAPRRPRSLPREITPGTVSGFLGWPPKRAAARGPRGEQTVGRYWRTAKGFFQFLGMPTALALDERPNLALPPPLVPGKRDVARWWQEYLEEGRDTRAIAAGAYPRGSAAERVVLMQALVLLTGMRLGECLAARSSDVEGHWLLLRTSKTGKPRILYLSARALGIAQALRTRYRPGLLFADVDEEFCGWSECESQWHGFVRGCRPSHSSAPAKPHQALRQVISDWMEPKDRRAESAQLGHGGGVVFRHYLGILKRIPKLLEKFRLPELEGFTWPEKIEASRALPPRLWEEFRRIVGRSRRRPA
jgi:integrase